MTNYYGNNEGHEKYEMPAALNSRTAGYYIHSKCFFEHSSQKISYELCVCVNLKHVTQYSNSPSKQFSLNNGENSNIQKRTISLYVVVPKRKGTSSTSRACANIFSC